MSDAEVANRAVRKLEPLENTRNQKLRIGDQRALLLVRRTKHLLEGLR